VNCQSCRPAFGASVVDSWLCATTSECRGDFGCTGVLATAGDVLDKMKATLPGLGVG